MTEQNHEGESMQQLDNRLTEMQSIVKLLKKGLTEPNTPEVIQMQAYRAGKIVSDTAWLVALQLSGFNEEMILKIYDTKDAVAENANADSNPS